MIEGKGNAWASHGVVHLWRVQERVLQTCRGEREDVLSDSTTLLQNQIPILQHRCLAHGPTADFLELLRSSQALLAVVKYHFVFHSKLLQQPGDADRARGLKEVEGNLWLLSRRLCG